MEVVVLVIGENDCPSPSFHSHSSRSPTGPQCMLRSVQTRCRHL